LIDNPQGVSSRSSKRNRQPGRRTAVEPAQIRVNSFASARRRCSGRNRQPPSSSTSQSRASDCRTPSDGSARYRAAWRNRSPVRSQSHRGWRWPAARCAVPSRAVGVDRDAQTAVALAHGAFQRGAIAAADRVQDPVLLRQVSQCGLVARIGDLAARGGGYRRVGPFLTPDRHRAIQNEPRSPPSHPEAAVQGDELGRL
jgi:hypothetical protein